MFTTCLFGWDSFVLVFFAVGVYACLPLRRVRWVLWALIVAYVLRGLADHSGLTFEGIRFPYDPTQNILNPTITYGLMAAVPVLLAIFLVTLCVDIIWKRPILKIGRRLAIGFIFGGIVLLLAGEAFFSLFSQNGEVIASAASPDGSFHVKAGQGLNLEGDRVIFVYRRSGEFFYHPWFEAGGDLAKINSVAFDFPSPHTLRIQTSRTSRIPGEPTDLMVAWYDVQFLPPHLLKEATPSTSQAER